MAQSDSLVVGDLEIDPYGCVVAWRGRVLKLPPLQVRLVYALATAREHGIEWVLADRLCSRVWHQPATGPTLASLRAALSGLGTALPGLVGAEGALHHGRWTRVYALDVGTIAPAGVSGAARVA